MLTYIGPEAVDSIWDRIKPILARTEDYGTDVDTVYALLKSDTWQLWVYMHKTEIKAVITTTIVTYPEGCKMLRIETVAGTGKETWLKYITVLERYAKNLGCVAMDIFGRKGWEKVLKPYDYEFNCVLLRKQLT